MSQDSSYNITNEETKLNKDINHNRNIRKTDFDLKKFKEKTMEELMYLNKHLLYTI